jgi:hypothetical protein
MLAIFTTSVVLALLHANVVCCQSSPAPTPDQYDFFLGLFTNFPTVMRTGYPDEGIGAVDPWVSVGINKVINLLDYDNVSLTFELYNCSLTGLSNATIEDFSVVPDADNLYVTVYMKPTTQNPIFTCPSYKMIGTDNGTEVRAEGVATITGDSNVEDLSYTFYRVNDTGDYLLSISTEVDYTELYGYQMELTGIPDSFLNHYEQIQYNIFEDLWDRVGDEFLYYERLLLTSYTLKYQGLE